MGWTVRGSDLGDDEISRTRPDRSGTHPASSTMFTGSFPGVKRLGLSIYHPPSSSAEVKKSVELYLYSISWTSWPVLG